eukprot:11049501-Lingulodinium_polyedra.AAC.1
MLLGGLPRLLPLSRGAPIRLVRPRHQTDLASNGFPRCPMYRPERADLQGPESPRVHGPVAWQRHPRLLHTLGGV